MQTLCLVEGEIFRVARDADEKKPRLAGRHDEDVVKTAADGRARPASTAASRWRLR